MGSPEQPIDARQPQPEEEIPVATIHRELEQQRQAARRLLNDLGSAIYRSASHVTNRATSAARRTGQAAQYVQDHYLREMVTGLGRFIRRHPAPSVAAILLVGFVAGRALRNR